MDRHKEGLIDKGLKAIRRQGLNGLSIIYITAIQAWRQIDKAICRQIDKPQYGAYQVYSIYHQSNGLSNPQFKTVYKKHTNIPIDIQTISSGYKGLDIWPNIRFVGYMV